jgi:hypothetical protein
VSRDIVMTEKVVLRPYDTVVLKAARENEPTPGPDTTPTPTATGTTRNPTTPSTTPTSQGSLINLRENF